MKHNALFQICILLFLFHKYHFIFYNYFIIIRLHFKYLIYIEYTYISPIYMRRYKNLKKSSEAWVNRIKEYLRFYLKISNKIIYIFKEINT